MPTTVPGTSFSVQAYAGWRSAVVKVRAGRVRVSAPRPLVDTPASGARPAGTVGLPNQQAVYLPGRLVAQPALLNP
ncbi:MAG: hypothetical protein H7Z21_02160 [Hymenobacter sp.]|nr:hypothetical protein [Hymenobacter sp.]